MGQVLVKYLSGLLVLPIIKKNNNLSGRLTLKLAQVASEQYIESTLKK